MTVTGTSGVSTSGLYDQPPPPPTAALRQNFQSLVSAIQSGDLGTAQQAYNSLTQALPGQAQGLLGQDLTAIGQALSQGDAAGAKTALSQLQSDAQQVRGGHHHHHGHGGHASGGVGATSATSTTGTTGTTGTIDPTDPTQTGTTISVRA